MTQNQKGLAGPTPEERPHPEGRRNSHGERIDPEAEAEQEPRSAVVSALVEHEPGVLARVSGLFSRRQFNIESLTVGPTTVEGHARITLVVEETEAGIDQIKKQLLKLTPAIAVGELGNDAVRAELVLLKVEGDEPDKVHAITQMYEGQTLDAGPRTITVQITGDQQKIDDAIDAFRQFGIIEIARTGQTALARGDTPTTPGESPGASSEYRHSDDHDQHADDSTQTPNYDD
ncbi:acetolactate synthase, small subunit [Halogranum gelatinilyticum]|uniref:Acetolactate synthase, small subunit n=1 Tax=Halogranum gelatinilyticum TaxID=660521 RepID=A0A1G9VY57_9EURY|nr:acetolactate synthase small subunit [Halogranum gelatinilyticum]SDM77228.1 acetolactate synthase, small subunit [Halogranum gelatinilyticum]